MKRRAAQHRPTRRLQGGTGTHGAISQVLQTAHAGARELVNHGMPNAAKAIATTASATAAIGSRVHGWAGPVLGALRPAAQLPAHRSSTSTRTRKTKTKPKSRKRRSPAQMRALRKMQAGAARARHAKHRGKSRKRGKGRKHRKGRK